MAEFVAELNPNDPAANDNVVGAAAELRDIKKVLKQTFPSYDEALDIGPTEIDAIETRIAGLEAAWSGQSALEIEMGSYVVAEGASGLYTTTGVGFQPTQVLIFSLDEGLVSDAFSAGIMTTEDGESYIGVSQSSYDTFAQSFDPDFLVYNANRHFSPGHLEGSFVSFQLDGFSIDYSVLSNGQGDVDIMWMAIK